MSANEFMLDMVGDLYRIVLNVSTRLDVLEAAPDAVVTEELREQFLRLREDFERRLHEQW